MSIGCSECRHILTSGNKCHQPALRGKPFCIHHCRTRNLVDANRARKHSISLPPLEDRHAVQMSIDVVLAALAAGKINRRTAATYAYAIKISSDNLAHIEQAPPPEPIEICRNEHGDILAAEQPATSLGAPGPSHLGTWESTERADNETPEPSVMIGQFVGAPGASHLGTGESMNTESTQTPLDDLRNTCATHEYDPEPSIQPTKTELRQKRRQVEQYLKQQREALRYWSTLPAEQCEKENPQLVVNCLQQTIDKCEAELQEITQLQAPDPQEPDPPL